MVVIDNELIKIFKLYVFYMYWFKQNPNEIKRNKKKTLQKAAHIVERQEIFC